MKKNAVASDLVTKGFLKNELKIELDKLEQKIDSKAQKYRDEVLTKLDGVMGELGEMREENIIGSGQTSQLRDTVEDHEKRIKHLEKPQQTA